MITGINGAHWLFYTKDPDADRAFFRDVLGLKSVDAGHGWLIFAMPPSEAAFHPGEDEFSMRAEGHNVLGALLYFMCDDVHAVIKSLQARQVNCSPVVEAGWGLYTLLTLPGGGQIGLYQPRHPRAV